MHTEKLLSNITLNHALEWQATKEKVCYICDTFDCYAYQEGKIKRIEAYLMHLLSFNEFDYLKHL
jgi:hypothetical protein